VALSGVVLVAVLGACAWTTVRFGHAPFIAGVYVGAGLTAYVAALHWIVDLVSAEHNAKYGTHGEEATADALRSRSMRAEGWRTIDAIPFQGCDVDHVAIRPGLVLAVETKWTNTPWKITDGRLNAPGDPLDQAARGARKIRHLLASVVDTKVHAIVVVWGKGAETLPRDVSYDSHSEVWIIRGRMLTDVDAWLAPFESAHPAVDEVDRCVDLIQAFVRTRDEYDARRLVVTPA
jgi:hypothetical protein